VYKFIELTDYFAILLAALTKRLTLRLARFFGITLPAAFINLLSATLTADIACALSPDAIAFTAFLTSVLVAFLRAMFASRFFSVVRIRFFADL
jgi:hypothetical protein